MTMQQQDRLTEKKHTITRVWRIIPLGDKIPQEESSITRLQFKQITNSMREQGMRGSRRPGFEGVVYEYPLIKGAHLIVDEEHHVITLQGESDYALNAMASSFHFPRRGADTAGT